MDIVNKNPKALIHKSELEFISRCVLDYPDIETGGDLFGFWTKDGNPVIQYVIGPGKKTTRSSTSFFQDIEYLKKCGAFLNGKHGLEHIGGWHSHHHLGLAQPSAGDVNTMRNALRDNNLPRFLIAICNISNNANVSINGFLFSKNYDLDYAPCNWKEFDGMSPMRRSILESDSDLFILPESKNTSVNIETEYSSEKKEKIEKPVLPLDSYWTKKEGREYLKMVFDKLKSRKDLSDVEILQLGDQRIAIACKHNGSSYEIIFPSDFPKNSPEVVQKGLIQDGNFIRNFLKPNKKSEKTIQKFIYSLGIIDKNTVIVVRYL